MTKETAATGILYGIGVGPGDSNLLTLEAVEILGRVKWIFAASSNRNGKSLALEIASSYFNERANVQPLYFPMTRDKERLEEAWQANCQKVQNVLTMPDDAAFVTLGDPSTYSTFTYLLRKLNCNNEFGWKIVPGITSYQASAAVLGLPLAEAEESLTIVSGAKGIDELEMALTYSDNIIIMKAYRHYREIVRLLKEKGLADRTVAVRRCGLPGQEISFDIEEWDGEERSYFTLLIVKKRPDHKQISYQGPAFERIK